MRTYTRALHPNDYAALVPWTQPLDDYTQWMVQRGLPIRLDHEHRRWEYASIYQQLTELLMEPFAPFDTLGPPGKRILDTGSGGSHFPVFLARQGWDVTVSDSMAYGETREAFVNPQVAGTGVTMPCVVAAVEDLPASFPVESFDVTMCISVIEHVDAAFYTRALRSLCRVTKPGGYLFMTSDYFRDEMQADASPFRGCQHTAMTAQRVQEIPDLIPVRFVGGVDLTYRGDFVNNYSFVNMAFQKTSSGHFE